MAVYTKIDNRDLLFLSDSYKLGKITKLQGIKKGIENTNYLYYMLKPKSDWMILYLNDPKQRELWLDIYKTMKQKFHLGFLFGLVAVMMFSNASCYKIKR